MQLKTSLSQARIPLHCQDMTNSPLTEGLTRYKVNSLARYSKPFETGMIYGATWYKRKCSKLIDTSKWSSKMSRTFTVQRAHWGPSMDGMQIRAPVLSWSQHQRPENKVSRYLDVLTAGLAKNRKMHGHSRTLLWLARKTCVITS